MRELLNTLGVEVEWKEVPEAYRVITIKDEDGNLDVVMPFGIEAYIDKMEEYVPGSRESMEKFISLCESIMSALSYIGKSGGKADPAVLKKEHANFLKCGSYSVNEVLKAIKMPDKAIRILSAYWCYVGVDCDHLNFAIYAAMVYKYLLGGAHIPKNRSHELSVKMDKRIRELGADIWYNTKAEKITMKDGKITGVVTTHGEVACSHVIACCSPNAVFGDMLDESNVPEKQKRMVNARQFGGRGFVVYLGLNRTAKELGLTDYSYFIYESLNTKKEVERAKGFAEHPMQATVCLNSLIRNARLRAHVS